MSDLPSSNEPAMSVVVRSFNRLDACLELLDILLRQDYPDFEVIVVEQSTNATRDQRERLEKLAGNDARLRVLAHPPLGPAGARNAGWKSATGEVVVFCDDDDLPIGEGWLRAHADNYRDPDVVGVSGREVMYPGERCSYSDRERARRMCLSYDFFEYPNCYCRLDERIEKVEWLHGGNASVRRCFVVAVDGWLDGMIDHEEHSFSHKLRRILAGEQRLVFDPVPTVLRRKDIAGGLERRGQTSWETYLHWFRYVHRVVGRYRTAKLVLLYPLFILWILAMTVRSIWQKSARANGSPLMRVAATLGILIAGPVWYVRGWISLLEKRK